MKKHHTTIGAHVRSGSNVTFVAPVTVGDGAGTGAGSLIRTDVPPGAMALSAGPQRNIEDWARTRRAGTPMAEAAARAAAEGVLVAGAQTAGEHEESHTGGPGVGDADPRR